MITTHVTWNKNVTEEERAAIDKRLEQMILENKTDGIGSWTSDSEYGRTLERNWSTVEAAEEWIAFITTYSPVSAQIID
jgi:hypothetical protein